MAVGVGLGLGGGGCGVGGSQGGGVGVRVPQSEYQFVPAKVAKAAHECEGGEEPRKLSSSAEYTH